MKIKRRGKWMKESKEKEREREREKEENFRVETGIERSFEMRYYREKERNTMRQDR